MERHFSMERQGGKNKKLLVCKSETNLRQLKGSESSSSSGGSPRAYDRDMAIFISLSHELKDEGNRLFQKRDYEGAILKYEKAIKLLPKNHIDISYLRSNIAACYMQLGISDYPKAIHECNLALEVTPKYSKALLKRARCYEALNRLDLAFRDVEAVLKMEPNNLTASEIAERVKKTFQRQASRVNDTPANMNPLPEYSRLPSIPKVVKEKAQKKRSNSIEDMLENNKNEIKRDEKKGKGKYEEVESNIFLRSTENQIEDKKAEDKLVMKEERISSSTDVEPKRMVKLVFGEDIRWAQIPLNCSILELRKIIFDRFPISKGVLVKYKDQEDDLVTITTTEELRWAEASAQHSSIKLYIVAVNPERDPFSGRMKKGESVNKLDSLRVDVDGKENMGKRKELRTGSTCINDWIIQFAQIFKNYVGFDTDSYLDLHKVGMELYSEAMEETVTSEEAQDLFTSAAEKFQEMAALALFNWGNVHMSKARRKVQFNEDPSRESMHAQVKSAYEWAETEYIKAGKRYEEALRIKPDFHEAILALGQQQFEQAKLCWYYAINNNVDFEFWDSDGVLQLYNNAEENMENGIKMWEKAEEQRLDFLLKPNKISSFQEMKLDNLFKEISEDEVVEQAQNVRSQIYVLWGTMLYERSIMEFKLGLPVWHECLEVAIEKFELAGASQTDIAVMIKNHCSNETALEGLGFNIDEIIQAWNEMYDAKRWQNSIPTFRLEPLLRRRASKLFSALEHA